jgi:hypothetical protein
VFFRGKGVWLNCRYESVLLIMSKGGGGSANKLRKYQIRKFEFKQFVRFAGLPQMCLRICDL